jgi:CreA protein
MLAVLALGLTLPTVALAQARIGEVDTTSRLSGRNDRIVVDRYDDPKVDGVSCYMSHAETGVMSGALGGTTDPNRLSIACRATGPVSVKSGPLPKSEVVFGERASPLFKQVRVTRLFDPDKRMVVYLVWSTTSVGTGGAAFNNVTAVPLEGK